MVTVSAETNPPTRIDTVEASVIQHLEISIFPSADYDLQVTLTATHHHHHHRSLLKPVRPNAAGDNEPRCGDDARVLQH